MYNDIRYTLPKGFQPNKLDTATLIRTFGWGNFQEVDSPEDLADYIARKSQFKEEKSPLALAARWR